MPNSLIALGYGAAAGFLAFEIAFDERYVPTGSGEIAGSHGPANICTDDQYAIH